MSKMLFLLIYVITALYTYITLRNIVGKGCLNLICNCSVNIELLYVDISNESGIHEKGKLSKAKASTKPSTAEF